MIVANGEGCKNCGKKNKPKIKELKKAIADGLTFPEACIYADFDGLNYRQIYNMFLSNLNAKEKRNLIHKIRWS